MSQTDAPTSVIGLQRFPVKSMGGESLLESEIAGHGLVGDREWAVYDLHGKLASGKHTRRFRRMDPVFTVTARRHNAVVLVRLPDGQELAADDPAAEVALSDHFGEPVTLRRETDVAHQDEGPLSIVGTATLVELGRYDGGGRPVDPRHLRANVIVETEVPFAEEAWVGRDLIIGSAVLRVTARTQRCRMVGVAQVGLPARPRLLHGIADRRDLMAGVYASVVRPGWIRVGDRPVKAAPLG